jgi:uncharacterized protein
MAPVERAPARARPFVHCFRTTRHPYVYDVNTNRILRVDAILFDVVAAGVDFSAVNELQRVLPQHSPDGVRAAAKRCEDLSGSQGVFSAFRPRGMVRLDPAGDARAVYEHGLGQLIIELTQACNLRCQYCAFSENYPLARGYTSKSIPLATAAQAIDYFLDHATDTEKPAISFYGGEPLLRFDVLRACVEHAIARRGGAPVHVQLTTNGTLITPERLDYFRQRSIVILVSLDGPAQCHDQNRVFADGRPTAARVLETLDMIRRTDLDYYRRHVGIVSVLAANTDPAEFFEYFKDHREIIGNGVHIASFVSGTGTDYWMKNQPSAQWCRSLDDLRWRFYESLVLEDDPASRPLEQLFQPDLVKIYRRALHRRLPDKVSLNGCCNPGVRRLYVDCDGRYHMCERINGTIPIGDVERGLDAGRISRLVDEYRAISEQECCDCWMVRFCGICFAACVADGRFDAEQKRSLCEGTRRAFHRTLMDYCEIAEINPAAFQYMDDIRFM